MKTTLYILFVFTTLNLFSKNDSITVHYMDSLDHIVYSETIVISNDIKESKKPNPIFQLFKKKQKLNKKITAAVLAFPFPFGMVGLHRIYLGTKPYVPVAYIASLGGVFGILPFIDFCNIMFNKDFDQYRDNGKVFMWIKD